MNTCATCQKSIRVCEECGGLICSPDCIDRAEDGCLCDEPVPGAESPEEEETDEA